MSRATRSKRVVVRLFPDEEAEVKYRAKAHRVSLSAFARARWLGYRPGSEPGSPLSEADKWWDALPPERRVSLSEWLRHRSSPLADPLSDPLPYEESK